MTKFTAVSAFIIRLRTFGLSGPSSDFYSELIVLVILAVHLSDGILDLLFVIEDLYLYGNYYEGVVAD
jgi:hypothetical protein